jgi:class 3 adenylate cyclase/tetratricopeptide (TPR) repeat protein
MARVTVSLKRKDDEKVVDLPTATYRVQARTQLTVGLAEDTLLVSLTSEDGIHLVGEVDQAKDRLDRMEQLWREQTQFQELQDDMARSRMLQIFGTEFFKEIIPKRVKTYLRDAPPCILHLALDASVAMIPWEYAFDGEDFLGSKFQIVRSILGSRKISTVEDFDTSSRTDTGLLLLELERDSKVSAGPDIVWYDAFRDTPNLSLRIAASPVVDEELQFGDNSVFEVVHLAGRLDSCLRVLEMNLGLRRILYAAKLLFLDVSYPKKRQYSWPETGVFLHKMLSEYTGLSVAIKTNLAMQPTTFNVDFYRHLLRGSSIRVSGDRAAAVSPISMQFFALFGDSEHAIVQTEFDAGTVARSFRQVTSLSYDLVGSTTLMEELGAELYSSRLSICHSRFGSIVKHWGGVSDRPQGDDGIMCYFGTAHAHEQTARSAISAAIELLAAAKELKVQIRVGLATGQVAVSSDQFVGLTVHLAARIQSVAQPSEILVSAVTASLARPHFNFELFSDSHSLKGFSSPSAVFKLVGKGSLPEPVELGEGIEFPIFGRRIELERLFSIWDNLANSGSYWLRLEGEAGIGKSHLIAGFRSLTGSRKNATINRLTSKHERVIVCRCFLETRTRAFAPLIALIERWFYVQATDDEAVRLSKIAQGIQNESPSLEDVQALGLLMGVPTEFAPDPSYSVVQEPRRRFLIRKMATWVLNRSELQPTCFVLEDLQWADPSTLEFLQQLRSESSQFPLFVIVTERSDTAKSSTGNNQVNCDETLRLESISSIAVLDMVDQLSNGVKLPQGLAEAIALKSDGIPLFVEMSTRMVLESPQSAETFSSKQFATGLPIPVTIRDLLMQRLDNLGSARPLVQICSAIGREFPYQLLEALIDSEVSALSRKELRMQLTILLDSELLLATNDSEPIHRRFYFRHALIQEAAYQSMWESDRRSLHLTIAQTIETQLPNIVSSQPEVLAHHYQSGGTLKESAKWHWLSARKYKAEDSHVESLFHLSEAKALLYNLPLTKERIKSELDVELATAGQLIATKGYGSNAAGQSYLAALSLAQQLEDKKSILRAQLGLEAYYLMRADFGQAHAYLSLAQSTAKEFDDPLTKAQCIFALANVLHHQGHAKAMQELCDACLKICRESNLKNKLVQSPEVMSLMYSAVGLWEMGHVDLARKRACEGVEVADRLGQRLALGQALGMQAMVLLWCGDLESAKQISERAVVVCQAGEHDMWSAHARLIYGCCISELGDPERGLALMDEAYELWISTGTVITRTFYLALRAAACVTSNKVSLGLELVNEACRIIDVHGERYYEPEVLRIKGELLLVNSRSDAAKDEQVAEEFFQKANRSAVLLGYHSLALRVSLSESKLHLQRGRKVEAIAALQEALQRLTEGGDTRDQIEAKKMLALLTT